MSAPAGIFAASAVLSIGCLLLRGRRLAPHLLACVGCTLIGLLVLVVPLEQAMSVLGVSIRVGSSMQLLGRVITIDQRSSAAISFLYLTGALFFSVSWASRPGRSFTPVGILILALLTGSLTIEPFLFSAIFLELAAMAAVLVLIPPGSPGPARVLQLLILYTLAMVGILFTGWLLENVGVTSVTPGLAERVMLLLALGFSILMFVPPFHFWLPSAARQVHPAALAMVALLLQNAGLFTMLRFLDTYAWLRTDPRVMSAIGLAGTVMVGFGSLSAMAQRTPLRIVAYALIADFGVGLMAIGSNTDAGYRVALALAGARVMSLVVYSLASVQLEHAAPAPIAGPERAPDADAADQERQPVRRVRFPLARLGSLVGLASLAGIPLSAGFPARWTAIVGLGLGSQGLWIPVGSALVMAAAIRWMVRHPQPGADQPTHRPGIAEQAAVAVSIALCLLLGLAPQLTSPWVSAAMLGLSNLGP